MGWLEHPTSRSFRDGRSNHVVLPAFARMDPVAATRIDETMTELRHHP